MVVSYRVYERRLRALLRIWSLLFVLMALVLAFIPETLVEVINNTGSMLGWTAPPLELPPNRFFSILAISLLVVLALLSHNARADLSRRLPAVRAILLSKVVSSGAYALAFIFEVHSFGYLIGALVDGGIALWTYIYYRPLRYVI